MKFDRICVKEKEKKKKKRKLSERKIRNPFPYFIAVPPFNYFGFIDLNIHKILQEVDFKKTPVKANNRILYIYIFVLCIQHIIYL